MVMYSSYYIVLCSNYVMFMMFMVKVSQVTVTCYIQVLLTLSALQDLPELSNFWLEFLSFGTH